MMVDYSGVAVGLDMTVEIKEVSALRTLTVLH